MDWSNEEFAGIEFGDKRLNERIKRTSQMLYEKPIASINEACGGWIDTKAAYRLFDNNKVKADKIIDALRQATLKRMKDHKTVLAIQDTTFFNYDSHESKTGLGIIHSNKVPVQGILAHNTLITTVDGLLLGLFDQKIYARKIKKKRSPHYSKIKNKVSYRWLESIQTLRTHISENQSCIVIGDREADIFELMDGCQGLAFVFIFRSTHDRVVGERQRRWGAEQNANEYLIEFIEKKEIKTQIEIEIDDHKTQKKRIAKLDLRFAPVTFPAPWRLDYNVDGPSQKNQDRPTGSRLKVNLFVVEVKEENAPKGSQKIHWRLLTSIPVDTISSAKKVIELYQLRWTIEIYHRVLKSGCQVEQCRLETFARLERCLTLYSVIAWRLLWMTKMNQKEPNEKCTKIFSPEEWHALYRISNKTKSLPKQIPSIRQSIRWMAQLGGFLARKSDGEPGITTVWRGWQSLNNFLHHSTYG